MTVVSVDVLIVTYRRPQLLRAALESVLRQQTPTHVALRVVVIDNDPEMSAERICAAMRVGYFSESGNNIALARNRALREACGEFAAFLDDDEVASPNWISALLATQSRFGAPIVAGPVTPQFATPPPGWVLQGRFFDRPRRQTGSEPRTVASGNVLLERSSVLASGVWFDPAYGRSGGEDTDFFMRLKQRGLRAIWCDEAEAHEQVSPERMRATWLLRRAFAGGLNHARIFGRSRAPLSRAAVVAARGLAGAAHLAAAPLMLTCGYGRAVRCAQRGLAQVGQCVGLCAPNVTFNQYGAA